MNATAMPSSNGSALSPSPASAILASLANSSISPVNGTLTDAGHPTDDALRKAAQSTRLVLGFIVLEFVLLWLLCVVLVVHVRFKRVAAFKGDDAAARKIILPAFEPLLIVLGAFNGIFMVGMSVAMAAGCFDKSLPSVVLETMYSAHQFGILLIMVFMLQKSVSIPALRRASAITLVLSGYTIPYMWWVTNNGDPAKQPTYVKWLFVLRAFVLLLSVYVFIWPPSRASTRTMRELSVYTFVRYGLALLHIMMGLSPETRPNAKYAMYVLLSWNSLIPIVIWRVLKADTDYWRGMGQRAVALQDLFKQKNHIHEGISSGGFHVLIEMHRK
ncbi:hypothetical protein Gpo141_00005596, partial [Globisporangium polare]